MIFRRPVSRKILEPITVVFISLLIGFMIFVSFYDVKKLVAPALKSMRTPETTAPAAVEKVPENVSAQEK